MATISDVARKSGLSKSTVSFVLNDAPLAKYISQETKERVRQTAEELGYRPNQLARYFRNKRSHTLGVIVFDVSDPYCAQILRGVEIALYKSESYLPILIDVQNDKSRFRRFTRLLIERQVEGLIVLGNSVYPEADLVEVLRECQTPVVLIGRELDGNGLSSVVVDNAAGASMALRHLYDLGHRRIAFLKGPRVMVDSEQRWNGIEALASKVGLRLDENLIAVSPLRTAGQQAGYDLTERLLRRNIRFTAIQAYDDLTAFGAIRALTEAGIRVPEQCSVVGFDDVVMSAYYNPPLTTVHQDMELQGSAGVEMLLDALKQPTGKRKPTLRKRVKPRLVVRASTVEVL